MLPDGELRRLRQDLDATLPDAASLQMVQRTPNGAGAWTETLVTMQTHVPCRLDTLTKGNAEQAAAAGLKAFHGYMLTVPYGTALTIGMRVTIGGVQYAVRSNPRGSISGVSRLFVEEL